MKCFEQKESNYTSKKNKQRHSMNSLILGKIAEANLDYRLSKKSSKDKDDYIKTINEALEGNLK